MHVRKQKLELDMEQQTGSKSKEQASFNFMAAITVHSGFGAQENKINPAYIM